jgi:glycosyltransferase involved in cell wall biosynthesis
VVYLLHRLKRWNDHKLARQADLGQTGRPLAAPLIYLYMSTESPPLASGEPSASSAEPITHRPPAPGPAVRGGVLYVWQGDYPWDVRVEKIARALTAAGFDTHVAARNRQWSPTLEALPEAVTHRLSPWKWAGQRLDAVLQAPIPVSPRWIAHLAETVRQTWPAVIIARDVPLAATAIWTGRRFGIPVILDLAENYPAMLADIWSAGRQRPWDPLVRSPRAAAMLEAYATRRAAHVVVVVEENAERLAQLGVPRERITIVSNTPPRGRAEQARPRAASRATDRLEVVYLGILETPRGLIEAIDAIRILRDRSVPVRLTVVGTGRDAPLLQAHARARGLTDNEVWFTGYVPRHEDALALVAAADVGIVPSRATQQWQTSIANKLFDYMATGLAVVTSDAAPSARIVRETSAGEVFRAGDAADLARALERLTDSSIRAAAGEAGRSAVLSRYNWERDTAVLLDVVDSLARRNSAVPRPRSRA